MSGNIGEWSEAYIFLKLIYDEKVDVADGDMMPIKGVCLKIIQVIKTGIGKVKYHYFVGNPVKIQKNNALIAQVDKAYFGKNSAKIWQLIQGKKGNKRTTFTDADVEAFLKSIFIANLSASSRDTEDLEIEAMDFRTGISNIMGFSCKSDIDAPATLFNASQDNTNFEFEVTGGMTDADMEHFNAMFKTVTRKGQVSQDVATGDRMRWLKGKGYDLEYVGPVRAAAARNLMMSGGKEMGAIVGGLLKHFYFEHAGSGQDGGDDMRAGTAYCAAHDVAGYGCDALEPMYRRKVSKLLYDMFTGMRLGKPWDGRSTVNGGYIVVKRDGSIVAYHSCMTEEFQDFLMAKLRLEAPSAKRHGDRVIERRGGKYFLKLALQVRFRLS